MQKTVERRTNGIACSACGAASAPPASLSYVKLGESLRNVCAHCAQDFQKFHKWFTDAEKAAPVEVRFNVYLSKKLALNLKLLEKHGHLEKCRVITRSAGQYSGYQCDKHATSMRDGQHVCKKHSRLPGPITYLAGIGEKPFDANFQDLLIRVINHDPSIKSLFIAALDATQHLPAKPRINKVRDWMHV